MKRLILASVAAIGLMSGLVPDRAAAQVQLPGVVQSPAVGPVGRPLQNPLGTPTISPFLNMGQGGNAALNYYGLVRPQLQTQQQLQQLRQQQLADQATLGSLTGVGGFPLVTGHETHFMNYGTFFPASVAGFGLRR
jgi:hypothetical protein